MDHQRRTRDLAEPVGDVVAAEQGTARVDDAVAVVGHPFGLPLGGERRFGDDQRRDDVEHA